MFPVLGSRARSREERVGVEAAAIEDQVIHDLHVAKVLVVLDAPKVEVAAAPIGEIGALEATGRVRQRDVLYVPAAIGALERTETGISGETRSRGTLNHRNRNDELVLVIEHPPPDEQR